MRSAPAACHGRRSTTNDMYAALRQGFLRSLGKRCYCAPILYSPPFGAVGVYLFTLVDTCPRVGLTYDLGMQHWSTNGFPFPDTLDVVRVCGRRLQGSLVAHFVVGPDVTRTRVR